MGMFVVNVALCRYKSKPIAIENKRWDPITGTTSAAFEGAIDIGTTIGNIVDAPMKEYRRVKTLQREVGDGGSIKSGKTEQQPE
jgi:hypothetical protein